MFKAYEIDHLINRHTQSLSHVIAASQDGDMVGRLSKAVVAMLDAICWFSGLRTNLAKIKSADQALVAARVVSACEKVQDELKAFCTSISDTTGASKEVADRCADAIEGARLLHEELELLRWDAMEWQADADGVAGRISGPFTSADALMASLMH